MGSSMGRVPGAPTSASASPEIHGASVSWPPPADEGSSPVTGYTVTSVPGGVTVMVMAPTRSATVMGLMDGTAYRFEVRAVNAVGPSLPVLTNSISTPPRAGPPSSMRVNTTYGAMLVGWNGPDEPELQNFTVTITDANGVMTSVTLPITQGGNGTGMDHGYLFDNLQDGGTYTVSIVVMNRVGPSIPLTRMVTLPCGNLGFPGRPLELKALNPANAFNVLVADVNRDQKQDVLAIGRNTATFLGRNNGTFSRAVESDRLDQEHSVTGDFNGDGHLDYVTVQGTTAVLFTGDSTGRFVKSDHDLGAVAYGNRELASADLNGDGRLDVVVVFDRTGVSAGGITVFLGNGMGRFPQRDDPVNNAAFLAVELADLNGDTRMDMVLGTGASTVQVRMGNGDGTFSAPVTYPVDGADEVKVADLNGDGKPDVVASGDTPKVQVLLNQGNGTLAAAVVYPTLCFNNALAVADLNQDGKVDVVAGGAGGCVGGTTPSYTPGFVNVLLGRGDGTFNTAVVHPSSRVLPKSIWVADMDGDNMRDVIIGNAQMLAFTVYAGTGDGGLVEQKWRATSSTADDIILLQRTANGPPDVVTLSQVNSNVAGGRQFSLQNFIPGTDLSLPAPVGTLIPPFNGGQPVLLVEGDFNRDGRMDVAEVDQGVPEVRVALSNADGTFAVSAGKTIPAGPRTAATCDLDGDGKLDLVINHRTGLTVLPGRGDGTFGLAYSVGGGSNTGNGVACLDVDGDAAPDIIEVVPGATLRNLGAFEFGAPVPFGGGGDNTQPIPVLRDVNHDNKVDVVVLTYTASLCTHLGNGDGTFGPCLNSVLPNSTGGPGRSLAVGDFDADGHLDAAVLGIFGSVGVVLGDGTGTFGHGLLFPAGTEVRALVAHDMNHDNRDDLVTLSRYGDAGFVEIFQSTMLNACF